MASLFLDSHSRMLDRKVDIHGEITRRSILEINEADKSVVKGQHFN